MYRIAVIGKQDHEIVKLNQALLRSGEFAPTLYVRPDLALQAIGTGGVQAWVLAIDKVERSQKNLILRIKDLIGDCPMLVLANEWDSDFEDFIEGLGNVALINKKNDRSSISGVLLKLIKGDSIHSRNSERKTPVNTIGFLMNQKNVTVKDLSNTGARVLSAESDLKPGDRVSLEVQLPSLNAAHFLQAEVMWVLSLSSSQYLTPEKQMAGVKFLNSERLSL